MQPKDRSYDSTEITGSAGPMMLTAAADVAYSTEKIRRVVEGHGATLVTGHDPEAWPKFKKAPDYYA